jgi:hypothetical protein
VGDFHERVIFDDYKDQRIDLIITSGCGRTSAMSSAFRGGDTKELT